MVLYVIFVVGCCIFLLSCFWQAHFSEQLQLAIGYFWVCPIFCVWQPRCNNGGRQRLRHRFSVRQRLRIELRTQNWESRIESGNSSGTGRSWGCSRSARNSGLHVVTCVAQQKPQTKQLQLGESSSRSRSRSHGKAAATKVHAHYREGRAHGASLSHRYVRISGWQKVSQ